MAMKDQVKESAGLGNLERQVKKLQGNIFDSPRNSPKRRNSLIDKDEDEKKK
jgi:hypothetical protein